MESHLLQMRGLKHDIGHDLRRDGRSHLLQMRGLKPNGQYTVVASYESHLLQMRGLKPIIWVGALKHFCRIFYRCVD